MGDYAKGVPDFSIQEGSLKSSKIGSAKSLLEEVGYRPNSIWELGQPNCVAEWTIGSNRVSLGGILKVGRAFGRRLSIES